MASACALARQRLTQYVDSLTPATVADKGSSLIKGGMIGGVSAPLKGVLGNATWGGYKHLIQQPVEAGFDYLQSVGRSIATGGKVKPHEFREVVSTLNLGGAKAFGKGFSAGAKTVTDGMKAGRAAQKALKPGSGFGKWVSAYMDEVQLRLNADVTRLGINTPTQVRIENPVLRAMTEASFAAVEGVDRPFFEGAFQLSHQMQAKLSAVRQGLKGAAREAEIERLLKNPTDEMMTRSLEDAMYATFKDKGAVAAGLENLRRSFRQGAADPNKAGWQRAGAAMASLGMDVTMPFTGVPTSIVSKGLSMTPLGVLSPRMIGNQANRSRALANVTLGSGLMAAGYALAADGLLEGPPPRSPNEREDIDATGQFNSIRVGDQWLTVTELGPLAAPLLAGAALAKLRAENPEAGLADQAGAIAGAVGKSVVDNSFMQGTKRMIDAVEDPSNRGGAMAAGVVGTAIPAAVGQAARIADPVDREAKTFGERLQSRIPFAREGLKERATPFGPQPPKTAAERISPSLPFKVTQDRSTPETTELRRLRINVGTPDRTITRGGERIELPEDAYQQVVAERQRLVVPAVQRVMQRPGYADWTDEKKRRFLEQAVSDAKERASIPADRAARLLRK